MGKRYTGTRDSTGTLEGLYKNRKTETRDPTKTGKPGSRTLVGPQQSPAKKTEPKPMTLEKLETVTLRKPGP